MNTMTETKPMTFEAFTEEVTERMRERYADREVRTVTVDKNNGVQLTGIAILPTDSGREVSVFPTIYLNNPYEEYQNGAPMDEIADRIADCYEESKDQDASCVPDVQHFEAVKDIICYRLINVARNAAYLEKIPHRRFLDLAVVYCLPVDMDDGSRGAIAVTDAYARLWQADEETIHACAEANTKRLFPAELKALDELIKTAVPGIDTADTGSGLFLLQNGVGNGGAGAILDSDTLCRFADEHGDFFILPSSISEVLLMPLARMPVSVDQESISGMVRDVNENAVLPEEVLSDNAYLYHAETGEIEILP